MLSSQYNLQQNLPTGNAGAQIYENMETTGSLSVRFGELAGKLSSGTGNAFIGYQAGEQNTGGSYDTFVGYQAGQYNKNSGSTTLVGAFAGRNNINGSESVFVGYRAGELNINGNENVGIGAYAMRENSSGTATTAIGWRAAERNLDGDYNTMIGAEAGQNNRSGNYNTMAGYQVARAIFAGNENTYFGAYAGYSNELGSDNCFIGFSAGRNATGGNFNIAIGAYSLATRLQDGASADSNVVIGAHTGANGTGNVVVGQSAGSNTSGDDNVLIGKEVAMSYSGNKTVAVGARALMQGYGECNTMLGYDVAPSFVTGSNNVFVGVGADVVGDDVSYSIAIGTCNVKAYSKSVAIGDTLYNKSRETVMIGFDITNITDNSVLIGKSLDINNAIVFKDPVNYIFQPTIQAKANDQFGPTDINYSYLLNTTTRVVYNEAGAGQFTSNILNSRGNRGTVYPAYTSHDLVTGDGQFERAVVHYGSALFLNSDVDTTLPVNTDSLLSYYAIRGAGAQGSNTLAVNNTGTIAAVPLDVDALSIDIGYMDLSSNTVSNVVTNLTQFNTSNTSYDLYIQKQSQMLSFLSDIGNVTAGTIRSWAATVGYWVTGDSSGNIYATGLYTSPRTTALSNLDDTPSAYTLGSSLLGQSVYLVRYTNNGIVTGAAKIDGASTSYKANVCTDTSGNAYVAGEYGNLINPVDQSIIPCAVTNLNGTFSNLVLPDAYVSANAFVVRYNASGVTTGAATVNSVDKTSAYRAYVDATGNLYLAGFYLSVNNNPIGLTNMDLSPSGYTLPTTLEPSTNAFVLKYNPAGALVASAGIVGMMPDNPTDLAGGTYGRSLCGDPQNNVYFVGDHRNQTEINNLNNLNPSGSYSGYSIPAVENVSSYMIRYNQNGIITGLSFITGATNVTKSGSTIDGYISPQDVQSDRQGNIYLTGTYLTADPIELVNLDGTTAATMYALPSSANGAVFLIKYEAETGKIVGSTSIDGVNAFTLQSGFCITCDTMENIYLTGSYCSTDVFTLKNMDGTISNYKLPVTRGNAAFIVRYDRNGMLRYVQAFDGTGTDIGLGIYCDVYQNIFCTGTYQTNTPIYINDLNNDPGNAYLKPLSPTDTIAYLIKLKDTTSTVDLNYSLLKGSVPLDTISLNTTLVGSGISAANFNYTSRLVVSDIPRYGFLNNYICTSNETFTPSDLVYTPVDEYSYIYKNSEYVDSFNIHPFLQILDAGSNAHGITKTDIASKNIIVNRPAYASNVLTRDAIAFVADNSLHTYTFSSNDFVSIPDGLNDQYRIRITSYDTSSFSLTAPTVFTLSNLVNNEVYITQTVPATGYTSYAPVVGTITNLSGYAKPFQISMASIPSTLTNVQSTHVLQLSGTSVGLANYAANTYQFPNVPADEVWLVSTSSNCDLQLVEGSVTNLNQSTYRRLNPFVKSDEVKLVARTGQGVQEYKISFSNVDGYLVYEASQNALSRSLVEETTYQYLYTTVVTENIPIVNTSNTHVSALSIDLDAGTTVVDYEYTLSTTYELAEEYSSNSGYSNIVHNISYSNVVFDRQPGQLFGGSITLCNVSITSNTVYDIGGNLVYYDYPLPEYTYIDNIPNTEEFDVSYSSNYVVYNSIEVYLTQASNYVYTNVNQQQDAFYNYGSVHTYQELLLYSSNTTSNESAYSVTNPNTPISSNVVPSGCNYYTTVTSNMLQFNNAITSNSVIPITRAMMFSTDGQYSFVVKDSFEVVLEGYGILNSWTQAHVDSGSLYLQLPSSPFGNTLNTSYTVRDASSSTNFSTTYKLYNTSILTNPVTLPTYYLTSNQRYVTPGPNGKTVSGIYNIQGILADIGTQVFNQLGINVFTLSFVPIDKDAGALVLNSSLSRASTVNLTDSAHIVKTNRLLSSVTLYGFCLNGLQNQVTNVMSIPIVFNDTPPRGITRQGFNYGISVGRNNVLDPAAFSHSWNSIPSNNLQFRITSEMSNLGFEVVSNGVVLDEGNKVFTYADCLSGLVYVSPLASDVAGTISYDIYNRANSQRLVSGLAYNLAAYECYPFPTNYDVGTSSYVTTVLYGCNLTANSYSDSISSYIGSIGGVSNTILTDRYNAPVHPSNVYVYIETPPQKGTLYDPGPGGSGTGTVASKVPTSRCFKYLSYTPDDIQHDTMSIRIGYGVCNISPLYDVQLKNYAVPLVNTAIEAGKGSSNYPISNFLLSSVSNIERYVTDGNSFSASLIHVPVSSNVSSNLYSYPIDLVGPDGGTLASTVMDLYPYPLSVAPLIKTDTVSIYATQYGQTSLKDLLNIIDPYYRWNKVIEYVLTIPNIESVNYATRYGVIMRKGYHGGDGGGQIALHPVSHFTSDELLNDLIIYQHISSNSVYVDEFSFYVTNGSYSYNETMVTATLNIVPVPYIAAVSDGYVYYNTVADAMVGISPLKDLLDVTNVAEGIWGAETATSATISIVSTCNIDVVSSSTGSALNSFTLSELESGAVGYKIQQGYLDAGNFAEKWPFAVELSPSTAFSTASSNELIATPAYRSILTSGGRGTLNTFESSNLVVYPSVNNQVLSYTFETNTTFAGKPVDFSFQFKPSHPISTVGMSSTELSDFKLPVGNTMASLYSFEFDVNIGSASGISNLFSASVGHSNMTVQTPNGTLVFNVLNVFKHDEWNTLTVSTIDQLQNSTASITIANSSGKTGFLLNGVIDTAELYYFGVHIDETRSANFRSSIQTTSTAHTDIPLRYNITNYVSIINLQKLEIDIYTPYNITTFYDPVTNNITVGKEISIKGTDNITLGKKFSTSGQNNIIIGNYIGVNEASPSDVGTTNDIYESIVIGTNSFVNSAIRDIISIGNSNLNDLAGIDPAKVDAFVAKRPIIIGNAITGNYIDYDINVGNTFLKTDVGTKQVYLGVNSERVAIGYNSNMQFDAYQDLYVAHGVLIGPWEGGASSASNTYALSVTGDVNFSGALYQNGVQVHTAWKYTVARYNSNYKPVTTENYITSATSTLGTGPIWFNSITTSTDGTMYVLGSYNSGIPYNVVLFNLDGTQSDQVLPSTYSGFTNLGTTCLIRYSSAGIVSAYAIIETQYYNSGKAVCTDSAGNIYITGYYQTYFNTPATLNNLGVNGNQPSESVTLPANLSIGAYLVRYGTDGVVQGATSINSQFTGNNFGNAVCAYSAAAGGGVCAVGSYNSFYVDPVTFEPDPATASNLPIQLTNIDGSASAGKYLPGTVYQDDTYIVRYDANGNVAASTTIIGYGNIPNPDISSPLPIIPLGTSKGYGVCTDAMGNLYVAGTHSVYAGAGVQLANLTYPASQSAFVLPVTGCAILSQTIYDAIAGGAPVDEALIGAYTVGAGVVPASYLVRYNNNGAVTGATSIFSQVAINASVDDMNPVVPPVDDNAIIGVHVDISSNVYATGFYNSTLLPLPLNNLDGTPSAFALPSTVATSAFLIRYSSNGDVVGTSYVTGDGPSRGVSICSDNNGYVYVTGTYRSSYAVPMSNLDNTPSGNGGGNGELVLGATASAGADTHTFVLKYSSSGALITTSGFDTSPPVFAYDNALAMWCDRSAVSANENNLYLSGAYLSQNKQVTLYNLDVAQTLYSTKLPASTSTNNSVFLLRYNNEISGSATYDHTVNVVYLEKGSNLGIGTTFVPYDIAAYIEGDGYVSGTLTASNINFLDGIYQNGMLYVSSQWITQDNNVYYLGGGVGVGKNPSSYYSLDVLGNINFSGNLYQNGRLYGGGGYGPGGLSNMWGYSSNNNGIVVPGTGEISYSSSNFLYRHTDNNIDFAFDVSFTVNTDSGGIGDYKLLVPLEVDTSYYLNSSIIGNASAIVMTGGLSNYFPVSIRTPVGTGQSNVTIRLLNGTTETPMSFLPSGANVQLSGMMSYISTIVFPTGGGGGSGCNLWIETVTGIFTSNAVGIGIEEPRYNLDVVGTINLSSNLYQNDTLIDLTAMMIATSNTNRINPWMNTETSPQLYLPSPGTLTYSATSNSLYRHIDNEVEYAFNLTASITQASGAGDYTISLPIPIDLSFYTSNTIIGNIWSRVTSGSLVSYLPLSVSTVGGVSSNELVVRFVNGTTETPLSVLGDGSTIQVSGNIEYVSPVYPRAGIFLSNVCYQDAYGNIGFNTFGPLRGKVDIVSSNQLEPALFVEHKNGGEAISAFGDVSVAGTLSASNIVSIGTLTSKNIMDTGSNVIATANVGIGTVAGASVNTLSVNGRVAIGAAYTGSAAPADGLVVKGYMGVGTATPSVQLHVSGNTGARVDGGYLTGAPVASLGLGNYRCEQHYCLYYPITGANVTSAQSFLNVGVFLVNDVTYCFEGVFPLYSSGSTGTHNLSILFGGTGTVSSIGYYYTYYKSSSSFTEYNMGVFANGYSKTEGATLMANSLTGQQYHIVRVIGSVSVSANGTLNPQYILSGAPGVPYVTDVGATFRIWPLGPSGDNVAVGAWY